MPRGPHGPGQRVVEATCHFAHEAVLHTMKSKILEDKFQADVQAKGAGAAPVAMCVASDKRGIPKVFRLADEEQRATLTESSYTEHAHLGHVK